MAASPPLFHLVLIASTIIAASGGPACGHEVRAPLDLVPAESLLCWVGRPATDAAPTLEPPSTLQTLLEVGTRVAGQPLDRGTQFHLRLAEMLGLMLRYPHALVLVDAQAAPSRTDPNAPRVDQLRFALIVQTDGQVEPFLRIIQKVVNEQTDRGAARLENQTAQHWSYQELHDTRLPDWAAIAWGRIDGHFVLAVGPGVWPLIAAVAAGEQPALGADEWCAAVRKDLPRALFEIFVASRRIQARLDPLVGGRASAFLRAWDADAMDQAHWVVGYQGRAVYCRAAFRFGQRTEQHVYADPNENDPRLLAVVPPDTSYAVLQVAARRFLPRLAQGYLSLEGPRARANIERLWAQNEAKNSVEFARDVLAHLGDRVVVHNDPPHPLRIPFAWTVLMSIETEPETVRRALEAVGTAWQATLDAASADGGRAAPFTLHRDDDGIWYLRFGLASYTWLGMAGPAWTVTDRFVVLSWSPLALREYLDEVERAVR